MERGKKISKILAILLAFLVAALALSGSDILQPEDLEISDETINITFLNENQTEITAEVADTPEERQKGLMNRSSLEENHGMLFIFPDEAERAFWMKNTYIPLDIIFIDRNKQIVNIEQADPEPNVSDDDLTRYRSNEPVMYVIEVNQGFSQNNSIEEGDSVQIKN